MHRYEDERLIEYINQEVEPSWEKRDFVSVAKTYLHQKYNKVMAIGGLRGTGKTVGLLQALLDDVHDSCYILAQSDEKEDAIEYIKTLNDTTKKNIVIDEYGWIKGREQLDEVLYSLVQDGKRIIITGTESITLEYLNYNRLIHRVEMIHTTLFSYEEYCRLAGVEPSKKSCEDYLKYGGVFKDYAIKNFESMQNYIETAIIDNLAGYMKGRMDKEKAKTLTYSVLYKAVCPDNLSRVPLLSKNKVTLNNFLETMGINSQLDFTKTELKNVADIFEQIGIIIRVPNLDEKSPIREQYYITNPAIACQLIMATYDIERLDNDILGHMFEASVMVHLANSKLEEHDIYFVNTVVDDKNKELDIVLASHDLEYAYLIECKLTENSALGTNSTMRSGAIEKKFFEGSDILGRYVVFNGAPTLKTYEVGDVLFVSMDKTITRYFEFATNKGRVTGIKEDSDLSAMELAKRQAEQKHTTLTDNNTLLKQ